jgi:hypothetical protein
MAKVKAFFDGSGSQNSEFLVLTGLAAFDSAWAGFDDGWRAVLADRTPRAEFLHMKDLVCLSGVYSKKNGWTDEKASKLITDCLIYAQDLDKDKFKMFSACIDMQAYRRVKATKRLPSGHQLCSRFAAEPVLNWYLDKFKDVGVEPIHYLFDQNERFKGFFEKRWIIGKKSARGLSNHWHLIKTVGTVRQEDAPALQLADMCAWGCQRSAMSQRFGEQKYQHIGPISEKILPFQRKVIDQHFLTLLGTHGEFGLAKERIIGLEWK